MTNSIKIFFILLIFNFVALSQSDTIEKLLLGQINIGKNVTNLNPLKVEAALNLVATFSQRYRLIPLDVRDSIANVLEQKGILPTPYNIGKELNASKLILIWINRLSNILRVDISTFNLKDSTILTGKGYSLIRYFVKDKNEPILDPALLTACQRAFAEMLGEPNLFAHLDGSFKVKPAPTLVIGSINYIESDTLSKWEIFKKKQVTSYFAVETMFEFTRNSQDYVVFDIATRDSIYSYYNLFEPENYSPPTTEEIRALIDFEIEFYLTGEFYWENGNAFIKMYLCKINQEGLEIFKESIKIVKQDNLDSFKEALEQVIKDLFNNIGG